MKITESRANDILHWLDDETGNHALLFEKMTLHRDAAALIRQLQVEAKDAEIEALRAEVAKAKRSVEHTHQWYAVRLEKIKEVAKREGLWPEVAAIFANGSGTRQLPDGSYVYDPPTYAQQLNMAKHRATAAEACVEALRVEVAAQRTRADAMAGEAIKHEARAEALRAEVERLKPMTAVTMGVGSGDGKLFVHGDYESIKAAQALMFRAERLAEALRLIESAKVRGFGIDYARGVAQSALRDHDQEEGNRNGHQ